MTAQLEECELDFILKVWEKSICFLVYHLSHLPGISLIKGHFVIVIFMLKFIKFEFVRGDSQSG